MSAAPRGQRVPNTPVPKAAPLMWVAVLTALETPKDHKHWELFKEKPGLEYAILGHYAEWKENNDSFCGFAPYTARDDGQTIFTKNARQGPNQMAKFAQQFADLTDHRLYYFPSLSPTKTAVVLCSHHLHVLPRRKKNSWCYHLSKFLEKQLCPLPAEVLSEPVVLAPNAMDMDLLSLSADILMDSALSPDPDGVTHRCDTDIPAAPETLDHTSREAAGETLHDVHPPILVYLESPEVAEICRGHTELLLEVKSLFEEQNNHANPRSWIHADVAEIVKGVVSSIVTGTHPTS